MNQNKNQLTTTTGNGIALRNASRSLKITNKLLAEVDDFEKHWEWWIRLSDKWRVVLLCGLGIVTPIIIEDDYPYTYYDFDTTFENIKNLRIDINDKKHIKSYLLQLVNLTSIGILEELCPSDLSPLSHLENLEELYLIGCGVEDIKPIAVLKKLKILQLGMEVRLYMKDSSVEQYEPCNCINDISPLKNLTNLLKLNLSGNPISQSEIDLLQTQLPNCEIIF